MENQNTVLNSEESTFYLFKFSMRILALAYFLGALFFFFIPDGVNYILNFLPIFLKILQPLPEKNTDYFWLPLVGSLMLVLTYIAYQSSKDPKNKILLNVHILSKFISSTGYLFLFITDKLIFGYLVGCILDFAICVFVFYLKIKTQKLKNS
ncbi:MAG TPA: hypothetical protein PLA12_11680 [Candidatus Hydrogenedens sp.]|nr:hypothetical protein [Candidatus Hydrogenedens sp.]